MATQNVTWRREFRGTIQGRENDPDSSYELVVSETDMGQFYWRASDFMAWHSHESNGSGFCDTLELAQEAARNWFFVDRFTRPNPNAAEINF